MKFEQITQNAKNQIRFYSNQQSMLKERWKAGDMTRDEYCAKIKSYNDKINAIQTLFKGVYSI